MKHHLFKKLLLSLLPASWRTRVEKRMQAAEALRRRQALLAETRYQTERLILRAATEVSAAITARIPAHKLETMRATILGFRDDYQRQIDGADSKLPDELRESAEEAKREMNRLLVRLDRALREQRPLEAVAA